MELKGHVKQDAGAGRLGIGLFFDESDVAGIRSRASKQRYSHLWITIRNVADHIAEYRCLVWEEDTFTIWYYVRNRLMDLALCVLVEEKREHVDALNGILQELCAMNLEFWQGPLYPNRPRTIIYRGEELLAGELETAQLAMGISIAYDWGYGYLTQETRTAVQNALREKAIPLLYHSACFQSENWVMNHLCVISSGLLLACLVMKNRDEWREQIETAKKGLELWMNKVEDDGSYGEAYHYWAYPVNCLFFGLYSARHVLGEEIPGTWRMGPSFIWALNNQVGKYNLEGFDAPAAVAVNQYDCPYVFQMEAPEALLYTRIFKMPLAQWYIEKFLLEGLGRPDCLHHVWHTCSSILLALDDEELRPCPPEKMGLSKSYYFADTGFVFMRDSWKKCGEMGGDTVLALQSGGGGRSSSHEHFDKNSICLYSRGEYFLVDPGHSCYRGGSHQAYDTMTSSHNTLNLEGQNQSLEFLEAGMLHNEARKCRSFQNQAFVVGKNFAESVSYIASDAHRCYEPALKAFVRRIWYVRPDYFVIWDHIDGSNTEGELNNSINVNQYDGKTCVRETKSGLMIERPNADLEVEYLYPPLSGFEKRDAKLHTAYHILPNQKVEGDWGSALRFTPRSLKPEERRVDFVWILKVKEKKEEPVRASVLKSEAEGMAFSRLSFEVEVKGRRDVFTLCGENASYKNSIGEEYHY